ncbi:MAG: TVP38/TMEM64 family protein [Candidatus Nanohalobium sp.]
MDTPRIFRSRGKERKFLGTVLGLTVFFAAAFFLTEPYHQILYDVEALRNFIAGFGPLAPAVLILAQASQVIIAPVPGPVVGAAAGYLFGVTWGTIYTVTGAGIGSAVAIILSKRYGRPFVEDTLADETMNRFDGVAEEHGFLPFLLMFLLPGFPDDAVCFMAGLTELDTRHLIVYATLGRLPGALSLTVAGNSLANTNYRLLLITSVAVIAVSAAAFYTREKVVNPSHGVKNPLTYVKNRVGGD